MIDPKDAVKDLQYPDPLVLSIDFDRVLHDIDNPVEGRRMGPPMPNAEEFMKVLNERGFILTIYTLRARTEGGRRAVEDWLTFYMIPFDNVVYEKPNAVMYIDDKGFRFSKWGPQMIKEMYTLLGIDDA